jgi:hypothetical protein
MLTKSCKKVAQNYFCIICDYKSSRKSSYDKHILTSKHETLTNVNKNDLESCNKNATQNEFICNNCDKKYGSRVGLWKHKKKCSDNVNAETFDISNVNMLTNMVFEVVKQNSETQKQNQELINKLYELSKNNQITNNTTHNNCNNKTFNLNLFLNETCKNAMNMSTFIDSLQLQLSDLENVGEVGFVEGISSIIVKNLNAMDVTLRPVHCTDKKRETMYIKDEDKWEKEDEHKTKLHKMIKKIANKNIKLISKFQEVHPEWKKITSKVSDQFNKIVIEAMGGKGENDFEKEEKIIKRVAKEVLIDKV